MKHVKTVLVLVALWWVGEVAVAVTHAADTDPAVVDWLRQHAIPLQTTDPGPGVADLQPLRTAIGDARIVALGEAAHGTHEFLTVKHRIVELLVEEMGFTVLALETNAAQARHINEYVQTGHGDPAQLVHGLGSWIWDIEEILSLVQWMRRFNESGKGRLQFVGFDVQNADLALTQLREFLARVDPGYEGAQGVPTLDSWRQVSRHLDSSRSAYASKGVSPADVDTARQNARSVLQNLQMRAKEVSRDRSMADNIPALLAQSPQVKVMIWTHNGHASVKNIRGFDPMGEYLRAQFGSRYVIVGSAFSEGSFRAMKAGEGLQLFTVPPSPAGSVDATFAATDKPLFLVDLRHVAGTSVATWFHTPHQMRGAGGAFSESAPFNMVAPADCFDVMLFIDKITASHPISVKQN